MKKILSACAIAVFIGIAGVYADTPTGFGAGFFLGFPTGITVDYRYAPTQEIEAKAAWDFGNPNQEGSMVLQVNWLISFPGLLVIESVDIPPFVGIGLQIGINVEPEIIVRIPFGIMYCFEPVPIELALEIGLGMALFPATRFVGTGGLAIRWRF